MDRRDFLKSLGLVGATSLAGCDGAPLQTLHAYLTPDENLVPGLAYWYALYPLHQLVFAGMLRGIVRAMPPVDRDNASGPGRAPLEVNQ